MFASTHRLAFVCAAFLAAVGLGLAPNPLPGAPEGAHAAPKGRPNIVLIQSDDQDYRQFTRRVMPKTKRLLSRGGTKFTDYIASTAQCCPSRVSLLTGQYAHNHGVTSNEVGYPRLKDKNNVLPVWLRQAGYTTIHIGKFLNGYERFADPRSEVPPGWDVWRSVLGRTTYYNYDYFVNGKVLHHGRRAQDNVTRVLNRDAVRVVHRYAPARRPFYLELDHRAPHGARQDPFGRCGRAPVPEPRDQNLFRRTSLPKPPSFNENDMSDKPEFISSKPKLGEPERKKVRKHWRCALASLAGVDRGVARVYQAVKAAGELRKTVFIFLSDNGRFYGQHRLRSGKVLPYEEALRLPLLIRVPKRFRDGRPRLRKTGRLVANIDLAPTILDLAKARPCPRTGPCRTMDGRSLARLLTRSRGLPAGRGLLTEYRRPDLGRYSTCQYAGIRTRSTIYIEHTRVVDPATGQCVDSDQREWYDLRNDPFELRNRCFGGRPANCPGGPEQRDLDTRLTRLRDCAGIAGRDRRVGGQPFCE